MGSARDGRDPSAVADRPSLTSRLVRTPWVPTLASMLVALGVFCFRIGRPAYWQDEAYTVELTRRSWLQLAHLMNHSEAPLAPYYVFMKPWLEVSEAQWWARLPSAVCAAAAVGVLVVLATRMLSRPGALAAGGLMIVVPSVSRYAQEARPYAAVLLFSCVCTLAWWGMVRRGGWVRGLVYAATILLLALVNVLALALVAAHVVGAAGVATSGRRRRALLSTLGWALVSGVVTAPWALFVAERAGGVAHPRPATLVNLWLTVRESYDSDRVLLALVLLALVALGRELVAPTRRRGVVVFALAWAVLPPVALFAAGLIGQKTMAARYFLVAVPGGCLLAGAGCVVLVEMLRAVAARTVPRVPARPVVLAGLLVAILLVAGLGVGSQQRMRTVDGHRGGDPRPLLELIRRSYPDAAVIVPRVYMVAQVEAYAPDLVRRMPLRVDPAPRAALVLSASYRMPAVEALERYPLAAVIVQGNRAQAMCMVDTLPAINPRAPMRSYREAGWTLVVTPTTSVPVRHPHVRQNCALLPTRPRRGA